MWKKIASLAGMISASLTVSSCTTADYRPITYKPIPTRTAKVPKIVKKPTPARPTAVQTVAPRSPITAQPPRPAAPAPAPFMGRPSEY